MDDLDLMVGRGEQIMWRGKPDFKCFLFESIFNPMLPFALIWAAIDLFAIIMVGRDSGGGAPIMFLVPFFLLHLMPVWIYLGGVLFSFRKYRNTAYIVTDRGIYVSGGVFARSFEMKPFTDLSHITIHRGIFDQMLGVGDVVSTCHHTSMASGNSHNHGSQGITICDIRDYQRVFQMIKNIQTDVYSDTMYPNDLRPGENHGYQTQYRNNGRW